MLADVWLYYRVLKEINFKIVLKMHLPSLRTDLKQINIQNLTRCVTSNKIKYIYVNLIICYGNETIKFVIRTKFLGVQIDKN